MSSTLSSPASSNSNNIRVLANGDIVDCTKLPNSARNTLYKTELCKHFMDTGTCRYGNKCQFAHGEHELRGVLRHPKYKTTLCKAFSTEGKCQYGNRCRFIHERGDGSGIDEQAAETQEQKADKTAAAISSPPSHSSRRPTTGTVKAVARSPPPGKVDVDQSREIKFKPFSLKGIEAPPLSKAKTERVVQASVYNGLLSGIDYASFFQQRRGGTSPTDSTSILHSPDSVSSSSLHEAPAALVHPIAPPPPAATTLDCKASENQQYGPAPVAASMSRLSIFQSFCNREGEKI